jgi:hypothetical protein
VKLAWRGGDHDLRWTWAIEHRLQGSTVEVQKAGADANYVFVLTALQIGLIDGDEDARCVWEIDAGGRRDGRTRHVARDHATGEME